MNHIPFRRNLHAACVDRVRDQRIVWHFCTPKSASTFFMKYVRQATEHDAAVAHLRCVPRHGNRPQVVCAYTSADSIGGLAPETVMLGPHLHALPSDDLLDMISDNHLVVVQTRPLLDTVVSFYDHLNKNPISPFMVHSHAIWPHLSENEKIDHLIHTYVPWHLQFLQGWEAVAAEKKLHWITYEDVVAKPYAVSHGILKRFSVTPRRIDQVRDFTRFNVGRSGRGQEVLTAGQKGRIAGLVNTMCKTRNAQQGRALDPVIGELGGGNGKSSARVAGSGYPTLLAI